MAISIGIVINFSISSALLPGHWVIIVTFVFVTSGKRVDRRMDKAGDTGDYGDRGTEEDKEFVPEGERYDIIYECVHIVWLL